MMQNQRLIESFGNVVESVLKRLQGSLEHNNNIFGKKESTEAGKELQYQEEPDEPNGTLRSTKTEQGSFRIDIVSHNIIIANIRSLNKQ